MKASNVSTVICEERVSHLKTDRWYDKQGNMFLNEQM